METTVTFPVTDLPGGHVLRVTDGQGRGVAVLEGVVWITQAGDDRDVFLLPGETFHLDRDGIAVVEALGDARLAVTPAPSRPRARGGMATTLLAAVLALGGSAYTVWQSDAEIPEVVAVLGLAR